MFDKLKGVGAKEVKLAMQLAKEKIEVESGNGAVKVTINGAMQVQKIQLDPELIDTSDLGRLEKLLESAFNQAVKRSMEAMAEKVGGAGLPGA